MAKGLKCLFAATCGLLSADGVRVHRTRGLHGVHSKMLAGVPVLNYDKAYGGKPVLAEANTMENWVLVAKEGATDAQLQALCDAGKCMRRGHPDKKGVPFFEIRGTEAELESILKQADGLVRFAEPDGVLQAIPELPGVATAASWGLDRIGAGAREFNGAGTHVFVLDTGIRQSHNDFQGRVIPQWDMSLYDEPFACNGDLTCAGDRQGHGTHCAGTVGGATFGVAPGASIHTVKVLSDEGSGQFVWSFAALDLLAVSTIRPAVASMSLGGEGNSDAMETALNTAVDGGVVVVVAGGNSNTDSCDFSPAFVPSAITVGSTTSSDVRSSFSNYGSCTDIWAPGSDIVSTSSSSDTGSRSLSGTSMACPHVSGASALVLQANPQLQPSEVLAALLAGAVLNGIKDLTPTDTNALLYVGAGGPPPTPVPAPTPPPTTPSVCVNECNGWLSCLFGNKCKDCPQCA